jgi:hypothetical protein
MNMQRDLIYYAYENSGSVYDVNLMFMSYFDIDSVEGYKLYMKNNLEENMYKHLAFDEFYRS